MPPSLARIFMFKTSFTFLYYLFICMRAMGSQFCPSSIWALRINLGLLGRMAGGLPHWAISLALQAVLLIHKNEMLSGCSQNLLPFLLMAVFSPAEMVSIGVRLTQRTGYKSAASHEKTSLWRSQCVILLKWENAYIYWVRGRLRERFLKWRFSLSPDDSFGPTRQR